MNQTIERAPEYRICRSSTYADRWIAEDGKTWVNDPTSAKVFRDEAEARDFAAEHEIVFSTRSYGQTWIDDETYTSP